MQGPALGVLLSRAMALRRSDTKSVVTLVSTFWLHKRGDVDIRHETAARQIDRMLISQSKPKWIDQVFGWAQSTGQLWEPKRVSQTKVTIPTQKTQLQDQLDMLNESSSSSKGPEGPMLILKPENSFGSMNIQDQLNAMEKMMGNFQTGGLVGATSADKYSSDAAGAASRISKVRILQARLWSQADVGSAEESANMTKTAFYHRKGLSEQAYKKLRLVWNSSMSQKQKLKTFQATFLPVLTYGLDALTVTEKQLTTPPRRTLHKIPKKNSRHQSFLLLSCHQPGGL